MTRSADGLTYFAKVIGGGAVLLALFAFSGLPVGPVLLVGLFLTVSAWADFQRRRTLHRRDDGIYVWVEWHGGERCSDTDPSAPGGAWDGDDGGDGGD